MGFRYKRKSLLTLKATGFAYLSVSWNVSVGRRGRMYLVLRADPEPP